MSDFDYKSYIEDEIVGLEDQSETKEFERELPKEGACLVRLVEYIEFGVQPQPDFQGKPKKPCEQIQLGFEIVSKGHAKKTDDGQEFHDTIRLYLNKSLSGKSNFKKVFTQLACGDESIKHMAQLLGKGWQATITHNKSAKTGKTYANIGDFRKAVATDFETGEVKPLNVPPALKDIIVFIFNKPLKIMWDKLYIDGVNDEGNSKNFIQEKIMAAKNYQGSPVMQMVENISVSTKTEKKAETKTENKVEAPKTAPKLEAPALPDTSSGVVDDLASQAGLA